MARRMNGMYATQRRAVMSLLLLATTFYGGIWAAGRLIGRPVQSPDIHFAYLAGAFLDGRLHLEADEGPGLREIVTFEEKRYVVYPPLPAMAVMPLVAVFGPRFETSLVSIVFGAFALVAIFVLLRRLDRPRDVAWWSALVFGFGTSYADATMRGSSWLIAHVLGVLLLTAGLAEIFGKNRGLLAGLLVGAALWCRLPMALAAPFAMFLAANRCEGHKTRKALEVGAGVGVFVALNGLYNWLRFGWIGNVAYEMIPGVLEQPWYERGIFHIAYVPRNLYALFLEPPVLLHSFPYIVVSLFGLGIFFATPSYLLIAWTPFRDLRMQIFAAATVACLLPAMLHGWPGGSQYGYRFSLDAGPFLIAMMAFGIGDRVTPRIRALILFNLAIAVWGLVFSRWIPPTDRIYPFNF
ncbi:MAG: hypothetical protein VYE73_09025 [Acidobacteriota bacterium]|nr:hypothetical protein [Acidobacteriota bacterium]